MVIYWEKRLGLFLFREDLVKESLITSSLPSKPITLDQFLKQSGIVGSGGQAKILIQEGEVRLNGQVETRRGKKLVPGDTVEVGNARLQVPMDDRPKAGDPSD